MTSKKIGWHAKPRTMIRFIKPGDIFMLALDSGRYGVGRILSHVSLGNVAEFFDMELTEPSIQGIEVNELRRRGRIVVLDSYSLFDRKLVGDWRIVAHQANFVPTNVNDVFFSYGLGPTRKKVDVFGRIEEVPAAAAANIPLYTPLGDTMIKREFYPSA